MHDQDCAARTLGLGRRTADLSAPEEHRVAMVISFGYPVSGRRLPVWAKASLHRGIPRAPLDEFVHYERW